MNAAAEPYFSIIDHHLSQRGQRPDDFEVHAEHRQPCYVVRMAEALQTAINEHAGVPVSLAKVLLIETTASGHVDYHRKLAWYCHELTRGSRLAVAPAPHTAGA